MPYLKPIRVEVRTALMDDPAPSTTPAVVLHSLRRSLPHRLKAGGIHLSLSAVIFGVALYLILVQWYPGFHFAADGGWQGVRIMAAVDLVLGPALTFIIFNPFKARRLIVFDLACIGLVQLGALIWGFYAVHGQRPVSINFHDGLFYSMPARSLRAEGAAPEVLARLSDRRPALVYVASPADAAEWQRVRERVAAGQMAHEDSYFFRAFAQHWPDVQRSAAPPTRDPSFSRDLPGFLARHGGQASDYRFFRYQGGYGSCVLALNAAGAVVDALGCETG